MFSRRILQDKCDAPINRFSFGLSFIRQNKVAGLADVTVVEVGTVLLCDLQSATIDLLYHYLYIVKDEVKGHAPH